MKKTLMTAMMTSISEVMETMFYLPVEPGTQLSFDRWEPGKDTQIGRLAFEGDVSGILILAAPKSLVEEMAENFMGAPREALTPDHLSGTLTEMLNMVCGSALSHVEAKSPYNLGIPEPISPAQLPEGVLFDLVKTPDAAMGVCLTVK